jgi:hypothetical protein
MNVRLQYDLDFMAAIYYEGQLQFNNYSVSLNLLTQSREAANSNIAMERLRAFVHSELENAVFVGPSERDKADLFAMAGMNLVTLPEEPVDQVVGLMLYCKLNAVMENRMIVTALDIQSFLGDAVWYQHDEDDSIGPFSQDGWWHQSSCQHNDIEMDYNTENVVKVSTAGWHDYGLEWPEEHVENSGNTVVFANFQKNENQPTQ